MKIVLAFCFLAISCQPRHDKTPFTEISGDTLAVSSDAAVSGNEIKEISTGNTTPAQVISFAKTLIGTPYKYGSTDPAEGFDCSGFITYVFNHFGIAVPRTSAGFTNIEQEINIAAAKAADIILFTGTDSTNPEVGHMGIITTASGDTLEFIHSTSGKANGVTVTPMSDYYRSRFVKVIRVFKQNDEE